jgi:hypothetical protein
MTTSSITSQPDATAVDSYITLSSLLHRSPKQFRGPWASTTQLTRTELRRPRNCLALTSDREDRQSSGRL